MSESIWLLSTRGRPKMCQEVLDACEQSGMTSPGVVYVDETVDEYQDIRLPENWTIHYSPEWGSLAASLQWCFERYPDAKSYGWLADDTLPRTPGWDKLVEEAAGDWKLAYCWDDWLCLDQVEIYAIEQCSNITSGLCWGGELVRTVGRWSIPPGVVQAGIDTAWTELVRPLGLFEFLPDVLVEHQNWRTAKRPLDPTDSWERPGLGNYLQRDIDRRDAWVASAEFSDIYNRVAAAVGSPLVAR